MFTQTYYEQIEHRQARRRLACGVIAGVLIALGALPANAAVYYDKPSNCLRVIDYPEQAPCTPAILAAIDRYNGWNIVRCEATTDTWTVDADLWIGSNDGTETYFQLGSRGHPREVLQVKGNVVVHPDWIQGVNEGAQWWYPKQRYVNRLTLGASNDPGIAATLSLDSITTNAHGVYVGLVPAAPGRPAVSGEGGQLHVFHGTITALTPDTAHALAGCTLIGNSLILRGATLSWINGHMSYGMNPRWLHPCIVEDTIFEHGGTATYGGQMELSRCTLRDVQTAVADSGDLDAVFKDCVFSNNVCNWYLASGGKGLTCIDCAIAPARGNDIYQARDIPKTGQRQYPKIVSKRHVIVKVTDPAGNPVTNAVVTIANDQGERNAAEQNKAFVNVAGLTPGRGDWQAILLSEFLRQATDIENKPAVKEYSYGLSVQAPGYEPAARAGYKPVKSWETITIVLKPAGERKNEK